MNKDIQNVEFDDSVLRSIENLVENGDVNAMLKLGDCYFKGNGIVPSKDYNKAAELFYKAGLAGSGVGYERLYRMCDLGYVLKSKDLSPLINYDLRKDYLLKAHELHDDEATLLLGFGYLNGMFGEANAKKAKEYLLILKSHNYVMDDEYETDLDTLISTCDFLDDFIDPKDVVSYEDDTNLDYSHQLELARKGNASAMCNIGYQLETGKGTKRNDEEAYYWYFKSAKLGFGPACLELALSCILRMQDCKLNDTYTAALDPNLGAYYLIKGAEYGDYDCMLRLVDTYSLGDMGVYDPRLALKVIDYLESNKIIDSEAASELRGYCIL